MTREESPNSDQDAAREYYPRLAPIMVAITLLLFVGMITLLGYRWMKMAEPNGFILVDGSKKFDGASIVIGSATGEVDSHGQLSIANDYRMRFPLAQGNYFVTISLNGKVLVRQSCGLNEGNGLVFKLDENSLMPSPSATEP